MRGRRQTGGLRPLVRSNRTVGQRERAVGHVAGTPRERGVPEPDLAHRKIFRRARRHAHARFVAVHDHRSRSRQRFGNLRHRGRLVRLGCAEHFFRHVGFKRLVRPKRFIRRERLVRLSRRRRLGCLGNLARLAHLGRLGRRSHLSHRGRFGHLDCRDHLSCRSCRSRLHGNAAHVADGAGIKRHDPPRRMGDGLPCVLEGTERAVLPLVRNVLGIPAVRECRERRLLVGRNDHVGRPHARLAALHRLHLPLVGRTRCKAVDGAGLIRGIDLPRGHLRPNLGTLLAIPDFERIGRARPGPRPRERRRTVLHVLRDEVARCHRRQGQLRLVALGRLRLAARRRRGHDAAQGMHPGLQVGNRQVGALARLPGQVGPRVARLVRANLPLVRQRLTLADAGDRGEEVVDQLGVPRHRRCARRRHDDASKLAVRRGGGECGAGNPSGRQPVGGHRAHAPLVLRAGSEAGRLIRRRLEPRRRHPLVRAHRPVRQREGVAAVWRAVPRERRRRVVDAALVNLQVGGSGAGLHAHARLVAEHLDAVVGRLAAHVAARASLKLDHARFRAVYLLPHVRIVGVGIERAFLPLVRNRRARIHPFVQVRGCRQLGLRIRRDFLVGRLDGNRLQLQGRMLGGRDEQVRVRRERFHAVLDGLHVPLVHRLGL